MANWRKQQGGSHHHQVWQWRPVSTKAAFVHSTVPTWEKKFCSSIGLISWQKLVESKNYISRFEHVLKWDDSAGKEAFDNAKMRYWARINGISCNISMPDPDIFNNNVDWNATVDPKLILDLDEAPYVFVEEQKSEEVVYVDGKLFLNQKQILPSGWEDDEVDKPKHFDPTLAPQGWTSFVPGNNRVEFGEKLYDAPLKHSKDYGAPIENAREYKVHSWARRNDPCKWNHREYYGGDMHKMGRGISGGGSGKYNGNQKRGNMSWFRTSNAYNGNNGYHHLNIGRRNNRGGRGRGHFIYVPKKVPSSAT